MVHGLKSHKQRQRTAAMDLRFKKSRGGILASQLEPLPSLGRQCRKIGDCQKRTAVQSR